MLRRLLTAGLMLTLAACGNGGRADRYAAAPPPSAPPMAMMEASDSMASGAARSSKIIQEEPGGGQPSQDPTAARQIAYIYSFGFAVPSTQMQDLLNAHKAACEAAGPTKCYVVNSSISGLGGDSSYGSLELRGSADWVTSFKAGMDAGLKPFNATLDSNSTSSEDLTVQMIDTSAQLNSSKTLRDRLQALLKDRPGKLGDLLDIERELARVQAEIDSTESILAAMRLRVAMSQVSLSYSPKYSPVSQSIWRPLGDAFGAFVPNLAGSLAAIVLFTAEILPWLIVLTGLVWFVVWLVRWVRRRPKRQADKAARPTPPPAPSGPRGV
jgi:hypothetical protein